MSSYIWFSVSLTMLSSLKMEAAYKIAYVLNGGEEHSETATYIWICYTLTAHYPRDITDAAAQQFATKQLRLASATNDMDGFVEIERDRQG